jgi:hypothetical protein
MGAVAQDTARPGDHQGGRATSFAAGRQNRPAGPKTGRPGRRW